MKLLRTLTGPAPAGTAGHTPAARRRAFALPLVLVAALAGPFAAPAWGRDAAAATAPPSCGAQGQALLLDLEDHKARHAAAPPGATRAAAAASLGASYLQLHRLNDAEPLLKEATEGTAAALPPRARAAAWIDLGNLHLARGRASEADAAWRSAAATLPGDALLAATVALNRARLVAAEERLAPLNAAWPAVAALPPGASRARLLLNLGAQALDAGDDARPLAWRAHEEGLRAALAAGDARLAAEAHGGLSELYERERRHDEALAIAERGIVQARRGGAAGSAGPAVDLLMTLEGRAGRLAQALGRDALALAAFRRAVQHVESVRLDIPVQYADGRSSFRETLEPIYLGLTDQLLRRAASVPPAEQQPLLRQARDTVELIKRTELEDYLRDRCATAAARSEGSTSTWQVPPGTAVYYPIILPDRLELLVETARGIERRRVAIEGSRFRETVLDYVAALRGAAVVRARSRELYRLLIAPIEPLLDDQGIHTLVSVPDGVLRLLPLASLHDGQRYLLQRLAVATMPGLAISPAPRRAPADLQVLLAGMSEPGPVADKLAPTVVDRVLDPSGAIAEQRQARSVEGGGTGGEPAPPPMSAEARSAALREALALPGVKREIENIAQVMRGTVLLDRAFTLGALEEALRTRRHPVVHIASHGLFGDSADTTFIMTYDEVLTLDGLQALLRDRGGSRSPIELLILSACQTAEGDDRAPLGMAGTALKTGARAAMGTLWPVFDEAASRVMSGFYRRLVAGGTSRIEALRAAQLELVAERATEHPIHWAPFILIGDWQ